MVKGGEDFLVQDAKSGEDLTRSVLTQIIFEQENKGTNLLPITVLRQLIRFYDDSMQAVVPSYLEHSINAFVADQDAIREKMANNFGAGPLGAVGAMSGAMQEQTRRNMEMFQNAMSTAMTMFVPFSAASTGAAEEAPKQSDSSIDELRAQLSAMQSKLDEISDK
jgi:polyhydroxyalkanoate synthesis repressor PhaR